MRDGEETSEREEALACGLGLNDRSFWGRRWVVVVFSLAVMAATCVPYLYGWHLEGSDPDHGWYSGFTCNVSDKCVYMAWMTRAAEGHFFERNLFTTAPQTERKFNVLFFAMGFLGGQLHIPAPLTYHIVRVISGVGLLLAIWWLLGVMRATLRVRWASLLIVAFSSGLGWLFRRVPLAIAPSDLFQPEGYTFMCLYWSPLFVISLLLMVGAIGFLLLAEQRQAWRYAVYAGLCVLVLGDIHTYDLVSPAAAWMIFLLARCAIRRKIGPADLRSLGRVAIVGGCAAVSGGYIYYVLQTDQAFAARAAVETPSPAILAYVTGYGLTLVLALAAVVLAARQLLRRDEEAVEPLNSEVSPVAALPVAIAGPKKDGSRAADFQAGMGIDPQGFGLMLVWMASSFAAAYLPLPFQRKLIMGVHVPLSILAGVTVAYWLRNRTGWRWALPLLVTVAILAPTNVYCLYRDVLDLRGNRTTYNTIRPYLRQGEVQAMEWLRKNAPQDAVIQPLPWVEAVKKDQVTIRDGGLVDRRGRRIVQALGVVSYRQEGFYNCVVFDTSPACYTPWLTGHTVLCGHSGESTHYFEQLDLWGFAVTGAHPQETSREVVSSGVRYVLFGQKHDQTGSPVTEEVVLKAFRQNPPSYLKLIPEASNADADVYEVVQAP